MTALSTLTQRFGFIFILIFLMPESFPFLLEILANLKFTKANFALAPKDQNIDIFGTYQQNLSVFLFFSSNNAINVRLCYFRQYVTKDVPKFVQSSQISYYFSHQNFRIDLLKFFLTTNIVCFNVISFLWSKLVLDCPTFDHLYSLICCCLLLRFQKKAETQAGEKSEVEVTSSLLFCKISGIRLTMSGGVSFTIAHLLEKVNYQIVISFYLSSTCIFCCR